MPEGDLTIQTLAGSLTDLNKSVPMTGIQLKGLTKRMVEMSDSASSAGKKWTTFSRLTSGTPIWKIQNKLRGTLEILAGFEKRSKEAAELKAKENQTIIDSVQAYQKMSDVYKDINKIQNLLNVGNKKGASTVVKRNKELVESIQSTHAYNRALLVGKTAQEAFTDGFKEIQSKAQGQKKAYNEMARAAKETLNYESKKGRRSIKAGLSSTKGRLKREFGENNQQIADFSDFVGRIKKEGFKPLIELAKKGDRIEKFKEKVAIRTLKFQKGMSKLSDSMKPILNLALKYFIFGIFAILGFMVLAKYIHTLGDVLSDWGVFDDLKSIFDKTVGLVGDISLLIGSFIAGDFTAMFDRLKIIGKKVLDIALISAIAAGKIALALLVAGFESIVDFFMYYFTPEGFMFITPILMKVGMAILLAYFIRYMISQALLLLGIYALPILMGVVVLAAGIALYRKFAEPVFELFKSAVSVWFKLFKFIYLGGWIVYLIDKIKDTFKLPKFLGGKAMGGISHGGLHLVGEQGPELVTLPAGAQVKTNYQSNKMMGGTTVNNYITINAKDTSKPEMRRIANELSNMINMKINRSGSSRTMR